MLVAAPCYSNAVRRRLDPRSLAVLGLWPISNLARHFQRERGAPRHFPSPVPLRLPSLRQGPSKNSGVVFARGEKKTERIKKSIDCVTAENLDHNRYYSFGNVVLDGDAKLVGVAKRALSDTLESQGETRKRSTALVAPVDDSHAHSGPNLRRFRFHSNLDVAFHRIRILVIGRARLPASCPLQIGFPSRSSFEPEDFDRAE